ncbi:MAG: NADH-quinone oxidoreductase subunit C [Deinococcales bacterium]
MTKLDLAAATEAVIEKLEPLGGVMREFQGMVSVTVPKANIVEAVTTAKDGGFEMISDVFGIDYLTYPGHQGKRFTVVYNMRNPDGNGRIFLRVDIDDGETMPTITHLFRAAMFMERETYDMFGIVFEGHPDLRRLLLPEDFDGHPHRKDFPLGETPTLFNEGRFLDPAAFRAGLIGADPGLTGWKGGAAKGATSEQEFGQGAGMHGKESGKP